MIEDTATLGQARDWLRREAKAGARCPCCRQYVKVYRRKLNSSMARALIHFHKSVGSEWFHADAVIKKMRGSRGDYCKLVHWGLIERSVDEHSGWWKITVLGLAFVQNRTTVKSHAVLYDGKVLRLEGDPVSIVTTLGKHFDYSELMAERPLAREPS